MKVCVARKNVIEATHHDLTQLVEVCGSNYRGCWTLFSKRNFIQRSLNLKYCALRHKQNNNNSMSTVLPAELNETGELRPSNNNNSMSRVMPAELSATGELRQTLLKTKTFATFHSKRNSCGGQDKRKLGLDIARSILNVAIIHRPPGLSENIHLKDIPILADGRNLRKAVRTASHSLWHVS